MIEIRNLTKEYVRDVKVLDAVSFTVRAGKIVGLVGSNGAGKTTALRILATLLSPTAGSVRIGVFNILEEGQYVRESIGYVPEEVGFYKKFNANWNLDYFAASYGIDIGDCRESLAPLLDRLALTPHLFTQLGKFSKGMLQKLALVRSLLHDPVVLLLDEPLNGLDVTSRIVIKSAVQELAASGKAVLLSTHILSDVEDMCHRVIVLERGRILLDQRLNALRETISRGMDLESYYLSLRGETYD